MYKKASQHIVGFFIGFFGLVFGIPVQNFGDTLCFCQPWQGGRNGARDPLRRTECQKALVARREPAKLGTGSLFLVAEDCSEVKGTHDSGGRWREYLPSLEGIQEDCRVRGQRSKGRGGLSVTQLFWETKRKKKKGVGW